MNAFSSEKRCPTSMAFNGNKHIKFIQQLLFLTNHFKAAEEAVAAASFRAKSEYAPSILLT